MTENDPLGTKEPSEAPALRQRGRPLEMSSAALIERIKALASRSPGLCRIHEAYPGLYARARRLFGSWAAAVRAAGFDYAEVIERSRRRSLKTRRMRRQRRVARSGNVFTVR